MGLCGLSMEREALGWRFILILTVLLLISGWRGCYFTRVLRTKVHLWNNAVLLTYLGGSALLALWPARIFAWHQLFNACSKLTSYFTARCTARSGQQAVQDSKAVQRRLDLCHLCLMPTEHLPCWAFRCWNCWAARGLSLRVWGAALAAGCTLKRGWALGPPGMMEQAGGTLLCLPSPGARLGPEHQHLLVFSGPHKRHFCLVSLLEYQGTATCVRSAEVVWCWCRFFHHFAGSVASFIVDPK